MNNPFLNLPLKTWTDIGAFCEHKINESRLRIAKETNNIDFWERLSSEMMEHELEKDASNRSKEEVMHG